MKRLIRQYRGKTVKYKDLPQTHQKALALYMSIDSDEWEFPYENWKDHSIWAKECPTDDDREKYDAYLLRVMVRNLNTHYVKKYGNFRIGMVEIPTEVMAMEILKKGYPESLKERTVEFFKEWVLNNPHFIIPNHPKTNRWPVILDEETVILDGWHRFAKYLIRHDETTPCLYYIGGI